MYTKSVIFAVFAVLVQNCFGETPTRYGLSEEDSEIFEQIVTQEKETLELKYGAAHLLFDLLDRFAAQLIWSQCTDGTIDATTTIETIIVKWQDSVAYAIESFLTALDESCSATETAKNETDALIVNAVTAVSAGLELALSGDYTENLPAIETLQVTTLELLETFVATIFGSFRTCLGTIDDDGTATIDTAENGSNLGLRHLINSFYNAIKTLAAIASAESTDTSLLSTMNNIRSDALRGLRDNIEHKLSWIKALYLKSKLDLPISDIFSIVYAQTVSAHRYEAATTSIFDTMIGYLENHINGFSDTGLPEVSENDIAQHKTALQYKAGLDLVIDSVSELDSDSSARCSLVREYFHEFSENLAEIYHRVITLAQANDVAGIAELRVQGLAQLPTVVAATAHLVLNVEIEDVSESDSAEFQDAAYSYGNAIHDGGDLLAEALFASGDGDEDYIAGLESLKSTASSAIEEITYAIGKMRLATLS